MTWCNGRSRKGSLDLTDFAEAPQIFIILIYEFSLTWILLLNKPQSNVSHSECLRPSGPSISPDRASFKDRPGCLELFPVELEYLYEDRDSRNFLGPYSSV